MNYDKKYINKVIKGCKSYIDAANKLNINKKMVERLCQDFKINTKHFIKRDFSVGQLYGKLTIKKIFPPEHRRKCLCECVCGKKIICRVDSVKSLRQISCGCFHRNMIGMLGCNNPSFKGFNRFSKAHYNDIIKSAKRRGIDFKLNYTWLITLYNQQNGRCKLTGIPIYFGSSHHKNASLDRIDSSKGYIKTNVRWIIKELNIIKGGINDDYFIYLCNAVARKNKVRLNKSDFRKKKQ